MPRRTQLYLKANWNGGLNDSVDPGVLPDNDLVIADNVIFATSGSRLKREGIDYFDNIDLPAVTSVTRSGTTVTITFVAKLATAPDVVNVVVPVSVYLQAIVKVSRSCP